MKRFIIQVLATAAVCFALTWFAMPILKKKSPGAYGVIAGICGKTVKAAGIQKEIDKLTDVAEKGAGKTVAAVSDIIAKTADAVEDLNGIVASKIAGTEGASGEKNGSAQTAASVTNAANGVNASGANGEETAQPAPPPNEFKPDESDARAALNRDPGYNWGVVVTNSFAYDANRNKIGIVPGGTVVASAETLVFNDGMAHRCVTLVNREWQSKTVTIYSRDLAMFLGRYDEADKSQRDVIVEYCELYGKLEDLRVKLSEKIRAKNPYAAAFRDAAAARKEFTENHAKLNALLNAAEGPERSEIMDKMRAARAGENVLTQRYNEARKRYDDWNTQNIPPDLKDIEMQNIENRMKVLRPRAVEIVPGI